ncbi:uncharacterized protein KY384_001729 [Bacidia gigantensis]|uniref:uncharacterized protein n=1 Tax=Bacidia gigantensis TaxID=2732470 RepID=UPI001D039C77|nr:uncharacterized protein KY384_001729 [Bacidia gigantensis]KAG8533986.1 hypothetical protein KY384_001729 [Bacidia gigantensis]
MPPRRGRRGRARAVQPPDNPYNLDLCYFTTAPRGKWICPNCRLADRRAQQTETQGSNLAPSSFPTNDVAPHSDPNNKNSREGNVATGNHVYSNRLSPGFNPDEAEIDTNITMTAPNIDASIDLENYTYEQFFADNDDGHWSDWKEDAEMDETESHAPNTAPSNSQPKHGNEGGDKYPKREKARHADDGEGETTIPERALERRKQRSTEDCGNTDTAMKDGYDADGEDEEGPRSSGPVPSDKHDPSSGKDTDSTESEDWEEMFGRRNEDGSLKKSEDGNTELDHDRLPDPTIKIPYRPVPYQAFQGRPIPGTTRRGPKYWLIPKEKEGVVEPEEEVAEAAVEGAVFPDPADAEIEECHNTDSSSQSVKFRGNPTRFTIHPKLIGNPTALRANEERRRLARYARRARERARRADEAPESAERSTIERFEGREWPPGEEEGEGKGEEVSRKRKRNGGG